MKRVLITGATGFIGRPCLASLAGIADEVHAITTQDSPLQIQSDLKIYWHRHDLLTDDSDILLGEIKPSHLLHLAWYAVPGKFWRSTENFRWARATTSLVEAFARHGGERVVCAGSCAEYDWEYGFCSERSTPTHAATTYGVCKNATQEMVAAFSKEAGLSSAWARIFYMYGPYEPREKLVAAVISSILSERPALCSHGNQIRDYLHVADVADALVHLLSSDVTGPINIGSGSPITLKDLAGRAAQMLGQSDMLRLGAVQAAPNDPPLVLADVRRLKDELNWSPKIPLGEGLISTIEWWRDELQQV